MSFLRFLMLLSLVVWVGGLIFFAFVLAPTAFQVLPDTHLAGNLVGRALGKLHWIAIVCSIVFFVSSLSNRFLTKVVTPTYTWLHLLVLVMLVLTMISQFGIIPRMDTLRAQVGDFATVPVDNPMRMQFDALHAWSTRMEGVVLLLGLVVIYLTTKIISSR